MCVNGVLKYIDFLFWEKRKKKKQKKKKTALKKKRKKEEKKHCAELSIIIVVIIIMKQQMLIRHTWQTHQCFQNSLILCGFVAFGSLRKVVHSRH